MALIPLENIDAPVSWHAQNCWSRERGGRGLTIRFFRNKFRLDELPEKLLVHVTADSRYRLFINGVQLGLGPLKGTLRHYHVETYDLAPHLIRGVNVISSEVRWFGENSPESEVHSAFPGWLVYSEELDLLNTPGEWLVKIDYSVSADTVPYNEAQQYLNHTERVDLRLRGSGDWRSVDYDDSNWERAIPFGGSVNFANRWGLSDLRVLYPRSIPALSEKNRRFTRVIENGAERSNPFTEEALGWEVGSGEKGTLILDAGEMTSGFPVIQLTGGRNREVRITYTEALWFNEEIEGELVWEKRVRDDISGEVKGYRDTLILSGAKDRYEPFHWRSFWFIKIEIMPGSEPCKVVDMHYRRCVYPQVLKADFKSSDPQSGAIWETSWRTAQLCAHETYEDCPHYEQLNYIADTRLQAMVSYYLANETRLARHCLRIYRDSLRPDGLISSREPSNTPQIIPYFCFHWIFMLEDYWQWVGETDIEFVRESLPIVDHILVFFRKRLRDNGFVGKIPEWNMVDHQPGWVRGEPPALLAGESTYLTCQYIQALDCAIRLHEQTGFMEDAERWRGLPEKLRLAIHSAWCEEKGLYLEGPGRVSDPFSEHTQCAAISAKVPRPEQLSILAERLGGDNLLRASSMQGFYVARAFEQLGTYHWLHSRVLNPWRYMLNMNASTWWEYPEEPRSDCHAWGSWIAADYLSTVLGIKPGAPGWKTILLKPQFDGLAWAEGSMETPVGKIDVAWKKSNGKITYEANAPKDVLVEVVFPNGSSYSFPEGGTFSIDNLE